MAHRVNCKAQNRIGLVEVCQRMEAASPGWITSGASLLSDVPKPGALTSPDLNLALPLIFVVDVATCPAKHGLRTPDSEVMPTC